MLSHDPGLKNKSPRFQLRASSLIIGETPKQLRGCSITNQNITNVISFLLFYQLRMIKFFKKLSNICLRPSFKKKFHANASKFSKNSSSTSKILKNLSILFVNTMHLTLNWSLQYSFQSISIKNFNNSIILKTFIQNLFKKSNFFLYSYTIL